MNTTTNTNQLTFRTPATKKMFTILNDPWPAPPLRSYSFGLVLASIVGSIAIILEIAATSVCDFIGVDGLPGKGNGMFCYTTVGGTEQYSSKNLPSSLVAGQAFSVLAILFGGFGLIWAYIAPQVPMLKNLLKPNLIVCGLYGTAALWTVLSYSIYAYADSSSSATFGAGASLAIVALFLFIAASAISILTEKDLIGEQQNQEARNDEAVKSDAV